MMRVAMVLAISTFNAQGANGESAVISDIVASFEMRQDVANTVICKYETVYSIAKGAIGSDFPHEDKSFLENTTYWIDMERGRIRKAEKVYIPDSEAKTITVDHVFWFFDGKNLVSYRLPEHQLERKKKYGYQKIDVHGYQWDHPFKIVSRPVFFSLGFPVQGKISGTGIQVATVAGIRQRPRAEEFGRVVEREGNLVTLSRTRFFKFPGGFSERERLLRETSKD